MRGWIIGAVALPVVLIGTKVAQGDSFSFVMVLTWVAMGAGVGALLQRFAARKT